MKSWVEKELAYSQMADTRLVSRLGKVLNNLSDKPHRSIPAANDSWAEVQGAYRFLDNDRVDYDEIMSGHRQATLARIARHDTILAVQDTTFFNFARHATDKGMGTLKRKESDPQLLHVSIALTPERTNLGVLAAILWQREEKESGYHRRQVTIENKESHRWLSHYQTACEIQKMHPDTHIVSIADREGDIHEWFQLAQEMPEASQTSYIIRAKSNRRVDLGDGDYTTLWDRFHGAPPLGQYALEVPAKENQAARTAVLHVYTKEVTFVGRQCTNKTAVELHAVYVKEKHPPKGVDRIEWMLLTNLNVDDFGNAETIIEWYRSRWEIEIFFKVLKNGSQVEQLRLETKKRMLNAIAIYLLISWRLHTITMMARECPDAPADVVFSKMEWQTIIAMRDKKRPPQNPPTLYEVTRKLGMLGGFIGRKGDGEPGVKTMWVGYQRLMQSIEAIQTLHFIEGK